MYNYRIRSGSVGRGEREPAPYRTSYGRDTSTSNRMSRASSYDPFPAGVSRNTMPSSFLRTDKSYGRSCYSGMSYSYHYDFTPTKNYISPSRYSSTDQLSSFSSHKALFNSPSGHGSNYKGSSAFTPIRSGSLGTGFCPTDSSASRLMRDYTLSCSRDFLTNNSSLSKFRADTTSSYRPSFSASASYIPRVRFEYRSKTPGYTNSDSVSRNNRFDRDYKSMSRFEKASSRESVENISADEIESTFQKLYNRYVKEMGSDDESLKERNSRVRPFISHSEAEEEASSDEEESTSECDNSFAEKLKEINERKKVNASITPLSSVRNSPTSDLVTPKCSPMMSRKKETKENVSAVSELSLVTEKEMTVEKTKTPAQLFREKHCDIELHTAILPSRQLKPVASAMSKVLKRDSLTIRLTEAIEKKKTATLISALDSNVVSNEEYNLISDKKNTDVNLKNEDTCIDTTVDLDQVSCTRSTKLSALPIDNGKATAGQSAKLQENNTNIKPALLSVTKAQHLSPRQSIAVTKIPSSVPCLQNKSLPLVRNINEIPSNQIMETGALSRKTHPVSDTATPSVNPPINALNSTPISYKNELWPLSNPEILIESVKSEEPTTDITISINPFRKIRSRSSSPTKLRRTEKSHEGTPQLLSSTSFSTCERREISPPTMGRCNSSNSHLYMERDERSKSVGGDPVKKTIRRRRGPSRTLDCLKEKLKPLLREKKVGKEEEDSAGSEEAETVSELHSHPRPPLLMVTQPSIPSTPMSTSANIIWNHSSDGEWTETEDEVDYESDFEYSVSQTFSLHDARPLGDLYPLSPSSSRCSPFVSDYDSDTSIPLFVDSSRQLDSRGRVDRLFAVPPPIFTCSITYDGQESWDEESLHSCEDYDDDDDYGCYSSFGRPSSSSLGVYMSPAAYSSDEDYDGQHFHESVQVGCTLRLVDRAAMKDTDDEYSDSEYYEDEEYSDEDYWDEDEEYYEDEEYDEGTESKYDEEESRSTDEERSSPLIIAHPVEIEEEEMEYEVMDGDFEVDASFTLSESKEIEREEGKTDKHREITYTQDLSLLTTEECTEKLKVVQDETVKAKAKRIKKDGTTGKAEKTQITQQVLPAAESIEEASTSILPEEELIGLDIKEHEDHTGTNEIIVIPTYVRPQTEKVAEESASRFADKKARSDFAIKAIIQPPKLQMATVQKVEAKVAQGDTKIETTNDKRNGVKNYMGSVKRKTSEKACEETQKTSVMATAMKSNEIKADKTVSNSQEIKGTTKDMEDKSGVRKSALNMTIEEAKKKAVADEELAKQKARRLGTVSSIMDRFKEKEKIEEPIIYKRSTRLAPKDEAPRKKYEVVKPVLSDEFDKQMEEIRQQMKAGSSQFQNQIKDLSKGISIVSEEAKKRSEYEKHKNLLSKATGVFSKAAEEKSRWREKRDAESEKDLSKIDVERSVKKIASFPEPQKQEEVKTEPKRTVRKINKEKSPVTSETISSKTDVAKTATFCPSFATIPKIDTSKLSSTTTATKTPVPMIVSVKSSEVKNKASLSRPIVEKPTIPQEGVIINDDNYDLFEAATVVATRRRKSLAEMRAKKELKKTDETPVDVQPKGPKGDGAAATRIRNILGNMVNTRKCELSTEKTSVENEKNAKRYSIRRKTQEIVNESVELKMKRRKQIARKNRFIRNPHDIDVLLGWEKENTFDLMEIFFAKSAHDRIISIPHPKKKRTDARKIWISDLTDIDKIYKSSEIRDIIASVCM